MILTNERRKADALDLIAERWKRSVNLAFFDPQYRSVLDHLDYGNEGDGARMQDRVELPQMSDAYIRSVMCALDDVLVHSGHLMLWVDKYLLCTAGWKAFTPATLALVDLVTWDKQRTGMGYRTRRVSEHLLIFQKPPKRAKGIWTSHDIPDVWREKTSGKRSGEHPHAKPIGLIKALIEATTKPGDMVLDPAAGSFVVERACIQTGRSSLCGDISANQ